MRKYNFFLDIDNTLLPSGQKSISDETFDVIKKAKESGCHFFINTARPYWLVPEKMFPSDVFDGICSGCGTYITYHGEIIYKSFLSDGTVKHVITELSKTFTPEFSILIEALEQNIYFGAEIPWYTSAGFKKLNSVDDMDAVIKNIKTQKLSFNKLAGKFSYEMFDAVKEDFDVMIHPGYAEMAPKGYNKGKAIMLVEEKLGIPHESTVAIGDSLNDATMMKYANISVAMGNAPDEVKALCSFVTDTSLNNGVAKAISRLLEEG